VLILTGDLDTLQLVNKQVKVYTFKKGISDVVIYDLEQIKKRFGLEPDQLPDYKALKGDPSDNIPGVPGIGDKTARELIREFGNLENLYFQIKNKTPESVLIKDRIKKLLLTHKEQAFFSKVLASIRYDVSIDFQIEKCYWQGFTDEFFNLMKKYEFFNLLSRFEGKAKIKTKKEELLEDQIERLYKEGIFSEKIYQIEKKLIPVIKEMEKVGIKIDIQKLNQLNKFLEEKLEELQEEIYKLSGQEFNINSPKQVSEVLFEKLQIPTVGIRKTTGGTLSTASSELKKIKNLHPIISLILGYREIYKIKSTLVEELPKLADENQRIHPHFNQLGTISGRISCNQPNLQAIPQKGDLSQAIRKCFVAEGGFDLVSFDYSQMELRIIALLSKDPVMLKAFRENKDIHKITASVIFDKKESEITEEERRTGKTVNFAVLYGMTPYGLSELTGYSFEEATDFIERFFLYFPKVKDFIEEKKREILEKGFSETYFGRKRFFSELNSKNQKLKEADLRMAVNHIFQGTAADVIKIAMVKLKEERLINENCRLLLQIHDELIFEIKKDQEKGFIEQIKKVMESIFDLLEVNIEKGPNLGELLSINKH
jgi:DNA polymerase I